jgi:hypothetical protein
MNASGTSCARAGSYDHFTYGFGNVVASRLPRYGSPIISSRCCCPEVTIKGVFPW